MQPAPPQLAGLQNALVEAPRCSSILSELQLKQNGKPMLAPPRTRGLCKISAATLPLKKKGCFWADSKLLEVYRPKANILEVFVSQLAGNYLSSLSHSLLSAVSEQQQKKIRGNSR